MNRGLTGLERQERTIFLLACGWVCCMCKAVELRSEVCLWVLFVGVCYALTRATAFRKSVTAQH